MIFWSVKKNYYWSNDFSNDQKFWNQKSNLFSLFSWNDRYREYRIHFFERSIDELITFVTFWSVKKNYLSLVEWFFKNFENLTYSLCFPETSIDIANIEYRFFERSIDELITEWHFDLWKRIIIGRMIFRMIKNFEIENLTYFLCFRETSIDIANIEYVFSRDRSMN